MTDDRLLARLLDAQEARANLLEGMIERVEADSRRREDATREEVRRMEERMEGRIATSEARQDRRANESEQRILAALAETRGALVVTKEDAEKAEKAQEERFKERLRDGIKLGVQEALRAAKIENAPDAADRALQIAKWVAIFILSAVAILRGIDPSAVTGLMLP